MLPHVLLEQQAERCIKLAYQCQNKKAERFLRLLAVDLMLAAQLRRPQEAAASERPAATEPPAPARPDVLSVLATLSRQTRGVAPRRKTQLTPESASTA